MKENWLEQGLHDKLDHYESPIDLESAWEALEAERPAPKKKRRFLIWWFWGLALLVSGSTYFLWESIHSPNALEVSASLETVTAISENNLTTKNKGNNSVLEETALLPPSNQKTPKQPVDRAAIQKTSTIVKSQPNDAKTDTTNPNLTETQNKAINSISKTNLTPKAPHLIRPNTISNLDSSDKQSFNLLSIFNQVQKGTTSSKRKFRVTPQLYTLNLSSVETTATNSTENNLPLLPTSDSEIRTNKKAVKIPQYIGLESGFGLRAKGKTLTDEIPLDVFSIQLFYQKYLSKKIYLKTGVAYQQFTNKLESDTTKRYTQLMDDQIILVNQYADGRTENVYGTAEVETIERTQYQIFNKYRFLSVPILFGVELFPFKKNSLQVESGFSATIFSQFDGRFLADSPTTTFNELATLDLKNTGLFHALLAVQWNVRPFNNSDWTLFLKYQGNLQLNDLSNSASLNIEKFHVQQLFMGLKYKF